MIKTSSKPMLHFNGFAVLIVLVVLGLIMGFGVWRVFPVLTGLAAPVFTLVLIGFRIVQPNNALVATLFGKYAGVLRQSGFFWVNPFYKTEKVSQRTANYVTPVLKVNDLVGNPIEIAAAVVYHIDNPAAAVLDIEDVHLFMKVQCESALRTIASHHPYVAEGECLSRHSEAILQQFQEMVQERVMVAGVSADEVRFTHLAYAAEVAQAMLRRQQAESIVAARATLVQGAIDMVEDTVNQLQNRNIVQMSEQEKSKLVTNMMTVLLSEEAATPVVNVSGE